MLEISKDEYKNFKKFLEKTSGIDLGENREYLVKSRLEQLNKEINFNSIDNLINTIVLKKDSLLKSKVIDAMTTNETKWFRDIFPFKNLENLILENKKKSINIWSAASSTGQEPYSLAIIAYKFLQKNPNIKINITASDISQKVLLTAKKGIYPKQQILKDVYLSDFVSFFTSTNNGYMVKENIRNLVNFKKFNILKDRYIKESYDIIFCRNVLIYFSRTNKNNILEKMHFCLKKDGVLVLGASENIEIDLFKQQNLKPGVIFKKV